MHVVAVSESVQCLGLIVLFFLVCEEGRHEVENDTLFSIPESLILTGQAMPSQESLFIGEKELLILDRRHIKKKKKARKS